MLSGSGSISTTLEVSATVRYPPKLSVKADVADWQAWATSNPVTFRYRISRPRGCIMAAPGMGHVKRRLAAIVAAGVLLLSQGLLSLAAYAQEADKLPRVGVLTNVDPTSALYSALQGAFRQGLRDLGYVEGKNVTFLTKSARGNVGLFPQLARELADANVNVMVVVGDQGLRAAKEATGTIPIVALMCDMPDHVMASFARPGGRATAVIACSTDLAGKRVQ